MGAVLTHEDLSNDWLNLDSRGPARGGLHDPWTRWMVDEAEPDDWEQVHGMFFSKKKTPRRTDARFRPSLLLVLGPKDMGIAAAA